MKIWSQHNCLIASLLSCDVIIVVKHLQHCMDYIQVNRLNYSYPHFWQIFFVFQCVKSHKSFMKNTRRSSVLYLTSNLSRISYITEMWPWILELLFKTKQKPNVFVLQGETQDCEVSLLLPCPKTCKNLWRSCVDHHSFFSSNRTARSPKYNNSTVQSYKKLITQHLGLGNSKTERWACACIYVWASLIVTELKFHSCLPNVQWSSVPACGGRDGVEPSPAEVDFIRAPRDQESALEIAPNHPKLVWPAGFI